MVLFVVDFYFKLVGVGQKVFHLLLLVFVHVRLVVMQGVIVDDGVAKDPHQSCTLRHERHHVGVLACVDDTVDGQRPHGGGVESVSTAKDSVDVESLGGVNDVHALVDATRDKHLLRNNILTKVVACRLQHGRTLETRVRAYV